MTNEPKRGGEEMSQWYEVKDINDLSIDCDKINIQFATDFMGAIYVSVPIALIKKLLEVE